MRDGSSDEPRCGCGRGCGTVEPLRVGALAVATGLVGRAALLALLGSLAHRLRFLPTVRDRVRDLVEGDAAVHGRCEIHLERRRLLPLGLLLFGGGDHPPRRAAEKLLVADSLRLLSHDLAEPIFLSVDRGDARGLGWIDRYREFVADRGAIGGGGGNGVVGKSGHAETPGRNRVGWMGRIRLLSETKRTG